MDHGQEVVSVSTSHQNRVDLDSQLQEFHQILKERDHLLQEVNDLKQHIEELDENNDKLREEHAEELAVLSSSFSQHFDDNNNNEEIKEYQREIQKLKNSIEDKNYHINQLQRKLMKTQVEMEKDLENHEAELENLRSQLEKLENSDTESLVESRMNDLKGVYEKEIRELKARLEAEEESHNEPHKDEQLSNTMKEVDELKTKLKTLEDNMDERLEEEELKFRREVMSVKDKLIHQHQLEIDGLLSQLERSNAEVEKLRRLSRQSEHDELIHLVSNGDIAAGGVENVNGLQDDNGDSTHFELAPIQIESTEPKVVQELENIHAHYQQQFDFMHNRIHEKYQQDLDENVQKAEEEYEHQLEKQRSDYEEKIVGIQRQLRTQFQADLERVTNDMEEQIQVVKDGHVEEVADLMQRLRGLSDDRRRSYIEQDNTHQHVTVIKEEFKSRVDGLEQELRAEKEKVADYDAKLQDVDAQIQAFKAEKQQEVKYIEEEMKKQCKALVEKKTKEVKERYQSELNEKVNKVEKTLRKQYNEESVRSRSELDESHRTLKDKYDNELSDIMTQMEQVQQRSQEVFEAEQKEQFEKQLSIVKEQLEPYKDKCEDLEKENRELLQKYNKDLSELKLKMDEVDKRYSENEKMEGESLRTLEDELNLYKTKVQELEEGNQMLVVNYGAQLENLKRKYAGTDDGEVKTLQEEVTIYSKKVERLQQENTMLTENYDNQIKIHNEKIQELTTDLKMKEKDVEKNCSDKEALSQTVDELSKQLQWYMTNCLEMEESKTAVDNRYAEEIQTFKEKIRQLDKDLEYYRNYCNELENVNKTMESGHLEEKENLMNNIKNLETKLEETRGYVSKLEGENNSEEIEKLRKKLQEIENEGLQRNDHHDNEAEATRTYTKEIQTLTDKITELEKCVHECRNNYNQLEEVKRALESQHVDEKEELFSEIQKQTVLVEEREKDLETVKNDKAKLDGDLRKVTQELESSSQTFEYFKTEKEAVIEEKNNVINDLSGKINKLQETKDSGDKMESRKLKEENESLKNETKRLKIFLESLRAENNQLLVETQTASEKHKKRVSEIDDELTSLRTENVKQSKELDRVKERYELLIVDLKEEIETQRGTLSELELTNSQYVQEIASLLAEMERVQNSKHSHKDVDNSYSSEENSFNKQDDANNSSTSTDDTTQKLFDEITELKAQNEQFRTLVQELEDEGDNKFGVLLSHHEKELEVLKEELEEQIARKREQLAQEAATKRQKLKEEYESKLRVIYEELVSERSRSKDQIQQINQLSQKVKLLEGINSKQKKDIERVKQMEEKVKELERLSKKRGNDAERGDDTKTHIKILEDKLLELRDKLVWTENTLNEKVQELAKATENIKSLEEQLKTINEENDKQGKQTLNVADNREVLVSEAAEELQSGNGGFLDNGFEETKAELIKRIQELESDKAERDKRIQEATLRNERLQKDLQNMDKAKEVVIQMYDEKMETLAIELDNSSERCDVLRIQFEQTKKMLRRKEKDMEDKQSQFVLLESELKNEKDTRITLKQKVGELEEQLESIERVKAKGGGSEDDGHNEELLHKLTFLEADLYKEKEVNTNLTQKIEEQVTAIEGRDNKLVEITHVVSSKDNIIAAKEGKINSVEEELNLEKKKSTELEKELAVFKDTDGTIVQRMEQMKLELSEEHDRNNKLLKQKYDTILSRKEEENRVRTEEFEAEIVTLKGMVDNLEQLSQLKDEDREIQLKEYEEKHNAAIFEFQEAFDSERKDLNEKRLQVTNQSHSQTIKVEELSLQVRTLSKEQVSQKKSYENEVNTLKKQLDFENSFQVELQEGFQTELRTTMEEQEREHKRELERVNAVLQEKGNELEETRSEHVVVFNELESTKQNLESRLLEIKSLEDRIVECKAKHEEEAVELTKKIENISANNMEGIASTTNDDLLASLRNDNKGLEDEVQRLKDVIREKDSARQEDIDLVTSELEKRFQERQDEMSKRHSEELDGLMMRLETLVHQESDSKALTRSHMEEINSVRNEMVQRVAELASYKEQEVENTKRRIEDHYQARQNELQDQLNSKCKEVLELHNSIRARADQQQSATEEFFQLRRENAELYRKLREQSAEGLEEIVELLRAENQKLKRDNENLKRMLQRNVAGNGSSESSSEGSRLLQLMKVMEQLMNERNGLEMKLREEILDLKTRFAPSGDISNASSNLSNLSSSPEKVTRESLLNMLHDLRSSKRQQEEDIQVHIREIEKMIEDIRSKIKSTECADAKIQEMLTKQLHHLEEQRRLLVNRLWKLHEKHASVEQKLAQQMASLSTQTSPRDEVKSKLYQNLLEDNLRKEKEHLLSKRQQVNDLRRRLSLEKALMDRKVAERQRLQKQLSEKDKQEMELSTERYELEKKWRDRLRMKEMELKQEQIDIQRRNVTDYRDSVAARISGLISRSSDDLSTERLPQGYDYTTFNTETNSQLSLNRHYLQREARTATSRHEAATSLTEYTHFRPYEVERSGPTSHYHSRGLPKRDLGFKLLPNEVPGTRYRNGLEHSSDEEIDSSMGFSNHVDVISSDTEDRYNSDIESYTPPSGDRLAGMEKDWERNLEEELMQISAGTLRVLPSGKVNSRSDTACNPRRITRTQSDLGSRDYVPRYYHVPLETGSPRSSERSRHEDGGYPRSSTAIPGEEHEWLSRNGSMNLSQMSTILPTLLKDFTKGREVKIDYRSPLKYRDSTTPGDQLLGFTSSNHSSPRDRAAISNSPNSSKSEPISRTDYKNKTPSSVDRGVFNSQADLRDRSAVYLLNTDDYIDRHRVLSSDVVARLRDLSPSEKYSYC